VRLAENGGVARLLCRTSSAEDGAGLVEMMLSRPHHSVSWSQLPSWQVNSPSSTTVYSRSSLTATASFAGNVHGVVVQMSALILPAFSLPSKAFGSRENGILTNAAVHLCASSYSSSASASAVLEDGLQYTGRWCLEMRPTHPSAFQNPDQIVSTPHTYPS